MQVHEVEGDLVVGADGSRGSARGLVEDRHQYFREYPYAWFGVLVQAPASAPELVYARSPYGFALISQRTSDIQRMYFQCDPTEDPQSWSDDRIWEQLQLRLAGEDGFRLNEGPVIERTVLPFRSFVQTPLRHRRLLLAGDAGHTVPPTGAKGLNLALADVRVLAEVIEQTSRTGDLTSLDAYTPRALDRVWRAQHFSYWMTTMLHSSPRPATTTKSASSPSCAVSCRRRLGPPTWPRATPAGHSAERTWPQSEPAGYANGQPCSKLRPRVPSSRKPWSPHRSWHPATESLLCESASPAY